MRWHRRRLPWGNGGDCPRRKTPHRAPPCEELDPPYDMKLVFLCRKLHLFLGKSTETAATGAALLTPISTGGETKEGGGVKRGEARRCMHRCMNFVHTVAFYNCRPYRYCHFQFVVIAFYCIYMYVYELCTQLRLTTVFKE